MRVVRSTLTLVSILTLVACASDSQTSAEPQREGIGFEAEITRAYAGNVAGPGVLVFLPDGGFEGQGYFFIADGQGIRPNGVTFILPLGLTPGRHVLTSPSPFDIGTVPSVRVDRDLGDSVASYENNTSGFIDLALFPDDATSFGGASVEGSFSFETETREGELIAVTGSFSFETE